MVNYNYHTLGTTRVSPATLDDTHIGTLNAQDELLFTQQLVLRRTTICLIDIIAHMIKKTIFTIALCVSLTSVATGAGNANTIWGIWVGNNSEYLAIIDTAALFDISTDWQSFHYTLRGDSLELFSPDSMTEDTLKPNYYSGFCFIIEHQDSDSIVLRPYRSSTLNQYVHGKEDGYLFDSNCTTTLFKTSFFRDTMFSFERLLFCYYSSSLYERGLTIVGKTGQDTNSIYYPPGKRIELDMKIIIDSTKTIYFYGNKYYMQLWGLYNRGNKKSLEQGYYQGCLSDSLYRQLLDLLNTSSLDRMRLKKGLYDSTGPMYSLDIYYDNKYKRTEGTRFPAIGHNLFQFLSSIEAKTPLIKSKTAKDMFKRFIKTKD